MYEIVVTMCIVIITGKLAYDWGHDNGYRKGFDVGQENERQWSAKVTDDDAKQE